MNLKVLGCHGGETPRHRTSSFLVDDRLAIDAGAITSGLALADQRRIEAVLVSHAHLDHVRDLATLADNRCQQGGPTLEIAGTRATLDALAAHFFNGKLWPDFRSIAAGDGPTVAFRELVPEEPTTVAGHRVTPVLVSHTIETAGFIVERGGSALAYSGDTGPTDRFWELLAAEPALRAVLLEVSFPNEQAALAKVSGHHTPASLRAELTKLPEPVELPFFLYHIKPVFQSAVESELAQITERHLEILEIGDEFVL